MFRNSLAFILGLSLALCIINYGLVLFTNTPLDMPILHWQSFLHSINHQGYVSLLWLSGLASILGGILAALCVKVAKVAYAMLIGFVLLFAAVMDVMWHEAHPSFYKIAIFIIFFPCSWLGGKIVELMSPKNNP
jgi:hypothetical protein